MKPSRHDYDEFYNLVAEYAATERISVHFGAVNSDPNSRSRESKSSRYVVWIGDRYDRSDKSLCHAANKVIKKIRGTDAD